MGLDPFLLALLRDPVDRGPLLYVESATLLYNPRRRVAYEVRDAIPVCCPTRGAAGRRRRARAPGGRPRGALHRGRAGARAP